MLVIDLIVGGLIFAILMTTMVVGIHLASRAHREADEARESRSEAGVDAVDLATVSRAELDEVKKFLEGQRETAGVL